MKDFYGERQLHVMPRIGVGYTPPGHEQFDVPGQERRGQWAPLHRHEPFYHYQEGIAFSHSGVRRNRGRYYGVGPRGYTRSDDRIYRDLHTCLQHYVRRPGDEIEFTVVDGEVTLTGIVSDLPGKFRVEQFASEVMGVRDIRNHLRLRQRGVSQRSRAVYAIFNDQIQVERALEILKQTGHSSSAVSALFSSSGKAVRIVEAKGTKAPEQAVVGIGSGLVIGGALGWLAGLGSIVIPGLGAFIAAGPIAGMLAGASAGGALGGLTGAMVGAGIPEDDAEHYEGRVKEGGILLFVRCESEEDAIRVEETLDECGAQDVSTRPVTRA